MRRTSAAPGQFFDSLLAALKKNKLTVTMAALFFVGMTYGSIIVGFGDEKLLHTLAFMTKGYMAGRVEQSLAETFLNSLYTSGAFVLLLFLLGFSAISIPAILFLPLFKGLGLGLSVGYLYITYGVKGVAFTAAVILPAALLSTFAIILAGREAFRLSVLFLSSFIPRLSGTITPRTVKLYCAKFLVLAGIVLISAIIDCAVTFLFSGFMIL